MRISRFTNHELGELVDPEPPARDEQLRELVDSLEGTRRYVTERLFFGGASVAQVARELGFSPVSVAEIRDDALADLRVWLEGEQEPPPPAVVTRLDVEPPRRCQFLTEWGRCRQPVHRGGDWCAFHLEMVAEGLTPDAGYHRRVVLAECVPVQAKLSPVGLRTTMWGRYRGDGRPSDQYVLPDESVWG